MEAELRAKFDYYFDLFRKDEQVNSKIKKLILENLGLNNEMEAFVDTFLAISKEKQYTYSIGLGYAMKFWFIYGVNMEEAVSYNEKARVILMSLPNYEKYEGILTVANNAILADIFYEDYGAAYQELLQAMPIAEKEERISYYAAFLNNGAAILSELGLYSKAIQQVEETLEKRDAIGESNYYITVFLLSKLYLNVQDFKRAANIITTHIEDLLKNKYFDYYLFKKQLIECMILENHREEATRLFEEVKSHYDFNENVCSDNCEVYLTFAHYFMYMEQYVEAEKYYLLLQQHMNHVLGNKRRILDEMATLYAKKHDMEKAYSYQQQAYTKSVLYDKFVDELYSNNKEDVWERNRALSYEVLYKRMLKVTEAGRYMSATLTWNQLYQTIWEHLAQIFDYQNAHLIIIDSDHSMKFMGEHKLYPIEDENLCLLLTKCAQSQSPIYFDNTRHVEKLANLYEQHSVSIALEPIIYQNHVIGIFYLDSDESDNFSKNDRQLLHVLGNYLSNAIKNIQQYMEALEKSSYDYLTSTFNRGGLIKQGEALLHDCKKAKMAIGTLMLDIDNFKEINDAYGHIHGDEVIKMVTIIMNKYKEHGIVARFGGEEFTLLIGGITQEKLYYIAEKIRHECEDTQVILDGKACNFTISIGAHYQPIFDATLMKLLDEADQKLYRAKNNGKNYIQM